METTVKSILFLSVFLAAGLYGAYPDAYAGDLSSCPAPVSPERKLVGSEITHGIVSESKLERQVEFLADSLCEGRATGSRGAVEAAFWIERQFRKAGIQPFGNSYSHSFLTTDGRTGRNIIGVLHSGGKTAAKPYIVVTAHYDGLGTLEGAMYPGADSNASGVAAMIAEAEMIGAMMRFGKVYGRNIIFAATDGKNLSMRGAKELWNSLSGGGLKDPETGVSITADDIMLMVNIDQIGSSMAPLRSGRKDYLLMLSDRNSDFYRGSLSSMNDKYGIGLELCFDYYGSRDFTKMFYRTVSEQRVFLEHGKPAVMFTSGITMNNNKTRDTGDTLDYEVMKKRIWLIFHWLERVL